MARYVPVQQPMYVSASPSGGNIIGLPPANQFVAQPGHSPAHIVSSLPGGPVYIQAHPQGALYPTTPIMPIQHALPPTHCKYAHLCGYLNVHNVPPDAPISTEPKVHYGLAASSRPLVSWDIYQPTSTIQAMDASFPIQASLSAVEPPVNTMRLVSKDMPWIITIKKSTGYISIGDVYEAIYTQMQEPIIHSEWRLMGSSQQKKVAQRFRQRNELLRSMGREEDTRGIRRVDYCLNKVAFVGLKQDDAAVKELVGDIDITNAWILVLGERR